MEIYALLGIALLAMLVWYTRKLFLTLRTQNNDDTMREISGRLKFIGDQLYEIKKRGLPDAD